MNIYILENVKMVKATKVKGSKIILYTVTMTNVMTICSQKLSWAKYYTIGYKAKN